MKRGAAALLRAVANVIVKRPETFDMGHWLRHEPYTTPTKKTPTPYCGTTACLAGHVVLLLGVSPTVTPSYIQSHTLPEKLQRRGHHVYTLEDIARDALGLTGQQARGLFYHTHWPTKFRTAFEQMSDLDSRHALREQARIARRRVLYFLRTGQ